MPNYSTKSQLKLSSIDAKLLNTLFMKHSANSLVPTKILLIFCEFLILPIDGFIFNKNVPLFFGGYQASPSQNVGSLLSTAWPVMSHRENSTHSSNHEFLYICKCILEIWQIHLCKKFS
jgi:hypothetical protein